MLRVKASEAVNLSRVPLVPIPHGVQPFKFAEVYHGKRVVSIWIAPCVLPNRIHRNFEPTGGVRIRSLFKGEVLVERRIQQAEAKHEEVAKAVLTFIKSAGSYIAALVAFGDRVWR